MDLCGNIVAGILYDCDNIPVGGVEQEAVLINYADIDRSNSVVDRTGTTHKVSHLQLIATKTGFKISGVPAKKHLGWTSTINLNEEEADDYTHGVNMRVYNISETTLAWLNSLGKGANVVVVFKNRDTGTAGSDKYTVVGWDRGLKVSEMNLTSLENKVSTPIVLTSRYDMEPHVPMKYFDTDVATSDTAFDALFA